MTVARNRWACVLAFILTGPKTFGATNSGVDALPDSRRIDATFLTLDAANSRVTYREERGGEIKTMAVSSTTALEKLARLHSGQKVVLRYRLTAPANEPAVDDVKKKPNWWKRGIILSVVVISCVAVANGFSDF